MKRKIFGGIAVLLMTLVLLSCAAVNGVKMLYGASAAKIQSQMLHLHESGTAQSMPTPSEAPSWKEPKVPGNSDADEPEASTATPVPNAENMPVENSTEDSIPQTENTTEEDVLPATMDDALFIGDSRTVGLAEYAALDGAHFFASVGMTVYNVWETEVSVPAVGKVSLEELLKHRQYGKIYIMLGINELGCALDRTLTKYGDLVDSVRSMQTQAHVFLMANLHVTKTRSEKDKYINNPAVDRFNEETAAFSDNETVFFLDANSLFDDADGNLSEEKSADNAHLKASYCLEWGDWIAVKTSEILSKAEGEKVC